MIRWLPSALAMASLVLLGALPLEIYSGAENLHDAQRAGQIIIFAILSVAYSLANQPPPFFAGSRARIAIFCILALGLVSTIISEKPLWAAAEISILVCCYYTTLIFAAEYKKNEVILEKALGVVCQIVCGVLIFKFFISYIAAYASGISKIDPWLLITGFDNIRFFGQFAIFMLPLLALPLLKLSPNKIIPWFLIVAFWALIIFSGTRGSWMAMIFTMSIFFILGEPMRRWTLIQIKAAIAGLLVFFIFANVLPSLLGMEVSNHAADRLNTSSSGRILIWTEAIKSWAQHPFLGVGPMHLANTGHGRVAHPHQFFLQWGAELGGISLLLLIASLANIVLANFRRLQKMAVEATLHCNALYICLSASLLSALTLSMVDGIFVMPISQLWFAVIAGFLLGEHNKFLELPRSYNSSKILTGIRLLIFWGAVIILFHILFRDWPPTYPKNINANSAMQFGDPMQPRFWLRGRIENK